MSLGGAIAGRLSVGLLPGILTALILLMALFVPHFLALQNLVNVLRASALLMIVSGGQMLVLLVAGFDLSVGSVVALASVTSALAMVAMAHGGAAAGLVIAGGVAAGVATGLVVGLVNGACVAFLKISPFMVTLGVSTAVDGIALILTNGIPVYGMPASYVNGFGRGLFLGLPWAVVLAVVVVALIWVMQDATKLGRHILAVGGNVQAARVSGVKVTSCLLFAYAASGTLAGIAALAMTAQIGSGQAAMGGSTLTLESIAAAVVAGVSLRGGVGRVWRVAVGAVFLLLLTNAMDLLHVDSKIQTIFMGIIIVLAVALEELNTRVLALV
jgi:ribose transport system permease protein